MKATGSIRLTRSSSLDHGRVAQRGTHRQLLRADGPYRRLRRSQARPGAR